MGWRAMMPKALALNQLSRVDGQLHVLARCTWRLLGTGWFAPGFATAVAASALAA